MCLILRPPAIARLIPSPRLSIVPNTIQRLPPLPAGTVGDAEVNLAVNNRRRRERFVAELVLRDQLKAARVGLVDEERSLLITGIQVAAGQNRRSADRAA